MMGEMEMLRYPQRESWAALSRRPVMDWEEVAAQVKPIVEAVRERGDEALREFTRRFDGVWPERLALEAEEIEAGAAQTPPELQAAIRQAHAHIRAFHAAQKTPDLALDTLPGITCYRRAVPIQRVGLYIPGGSAPLFSTLLMLGTPARLAGCEEIVLCTPPQRDGSIFPAILFAASLLGIRRVVRAGGAQAIAALAYGTESVLAVDKIFGPGNQYVTAAKQLVARAGVAIDLPAGPSELAVLADRSARADFVAADLLSQAEHGPDSQVILVSPHEELIEAVREETYRQLRFLPRREVAAQALAHSKALLVESLAEGMDFLNLYAPEHLILAVQDDEFWASKVLNAGSVFMGHYSPESAGDYASGTNHTLPTNGHARAHGGVSLDSFVKKITYQRISPEGLRRLAPTVSAMAEAEGLSGHRRAVSIRLDQPPAQE